MEPEALTKAKQKIAHYCAYQERCQQEVRSKLYQYGLYKNQVEETLAWLITEGYLNEERFAKTFAGGKFRVKKWGKLKIEQALKQKQLSSYCIRKGMAEIDTDEYAHTLTQLAKHKWNNYQQSVPDTFTRRQKTARFLIAKGYEPDLVWPVVSNLAP